MESPISLQAVEETAELINSHIVETPVVEWAAPELRAMLSSDTTVYGKLEMFQGSGTFKARGALSNILRLDHEQLRNGVTAMSAGNHAVAVSYAAKAAGTHAKVVMQKSANPARVKLAKDYGAEIVMADDGATGFAKAEEISQSEGRFFVPPFDGAATVRGTATLGRELHRQVGQLDVLFIAIGGGGLAGGVAAITKILYPHCHIIGVEPKGADCMHRSFASGKAENMSAPQTIADSLAPPMTLPLPFSLCRDNVDELVLVSDMEISKAMNLIFRDLKLAVEPACAAATAALVRMARKLNGKKVGVVLCGSNIDIDSFVKFCAMSN